MEYYIYVHRDKQGSAFYVGKGKGKRAYLPTERNQQWHQAVEKNGGEFAVEIVAENLTENQALFVEQCIIKSMNPGLVNVKTVSEVITPQRYKKKVPTTREVRRVMMPKENQNIVRAAALEKKLTKLNLTQQEEDFMSSWKATATAKQLKDSDLAFRQSIAKKLKQRSKLQEKLSLLNQ